MSKNFVTPAIPRSLLGVIRNKNKASLFMQIEYWLQRCGKCIDGTIWIYNTYDVWAEQLGVSKSTVIRIIKFLEENGYIFSKKMNVHRSNHTKWYTINYEHPVVIKLIEEKRIKSVSKILKSKVMQDNIRDNLTIPCCQFDNIYNITKNNLTKNSINTRDVNTDFKILVDEISIPPEIPISPTNQKGVWNEIVEVEKYWPTGKAQVFLDDKTKCFTPLGRLEMQEKLVHTFRHSVKRRGILRLERHKLNYMFFANVTQTLRLKQQHGDKFRFLGDRLAYRESRQHQYEQDKPNYRAIVERRQRLEMGTGKPNPLPLGYPIPIGFTTVPEPDIEYLPREKEVSTQEWQNSLKNLIENLERKVNNGNIRTH
jgi:DNA-binding Lrp family transcriptional regulator